MSGARYLPGSWLALAGRDVFALVPGSSAAALIDRLWARVTGGEPDFAALLQVIASEGAASLSALPPFAVVAVAGDTARAAVRGPITVEVHTAGGERRAVAGEDVATWREEWFNEPSAIQIAAVPPSRADAVDGPGAAGTAAGRHSAAARPDAADPTGPWLPVGLAVVYARRLEAVLPQRQASPAAPAPPPQAAKADADADAHAAPKPTAKADADEPPTPAPSPPTPPQPPAAPPEPAAAPPRPQPASPPAPPAPRPMLGGLGIPGAPALPTPPMRGAPPPPRPAFAGLGIPGAPSLPKPPGRGGPAAAPPPTPAQASPPASADATILPDPTATWLPPDQLADSPASPPAAGQAPGAGAAPGALEPYDFLWDEATRTATPEEAAVRNPDQPDGASAQSSAADRITALEDHDGQTIAAVGRPAGAQPHAIGPPVLARVCAVCGRPNPTLRPACAGCGAALTGDARMVPRPPLGQAMLSNGEQFPLDRSLVVGRKPRSPRFAPGDEPRLVALGDDYQDISRSHVLIALDDWSVTVHDLGSTNGTWLKRVGQPDRRLGESDPVLAESGDVYDIGDGLTITLAGLP